MHLRHPDPHLGRASSAWGSFAFSVLPAALIAALALAVAALPLELAALLVLGAIAVALALLDPLGAAALAVLSVPVQELVTLPGGLTVTQAALLLAAASLALHTLARPEEPLRPGRIFPALTVFLWALALAAVLTPFSRAEALRETARWGTVALIYLLALRAARGAPWRVGVLVACLLLAPAANAVVGLVQFWFGLGPESFMVGARARAYGTIGQPNSFAGYMNQAWPLAAGLSLFALAGLLNARGPCCRHGTWALQGGPALPGTRAGATARRWALITLAGAGTALAVTGAALLASLSRGGWVGALGGAAALAVAAFALLPPTLRKVARQLAVAGGCAALALALLGGGGLLPDAIAGRLASLSGSLRLFDARGADITPANFAVVERMAHLQAAWHMLQRHPLTGVGPGNYSIAYETPPAAGEDPVSVRPWYDSRGHAHNYYLHIAAEAGLIGLGAYLALVATVAAQAARAVRSARSWLRQGLAVGGAGVVAAVAVHNMFENLHVLNMGLQLGTIWALLTLEEQKQ